MSNTEIRRKKFDKEFYNKRNDPYYNKLKYLYVNDEFKSLPSVRNYFDKIRFKDNKELYKNSIKYANELNDRYEKFFNKTTLIKNELNKRFVRLDESNVENYGIWIHEAEIRALQKSNRNGYYVQTTKFYNKKTLTSRGEYKPVIIKTTIMLNTKAKRKIVYQEIINKLTTDGSEYDWKIRKWIFGEENAGFLEDGIIRKKTGHYATIETIVYNNIARVNNVINQVYQENESLTCVYDGFLKFFNNSNCKDKKTMYNKLIKNADI
jgi:dsDNA-binding SOS-regulon protein